MRLVTGRDKAGGAGGDAVRLTLFGPPRVTRAGHPVTFDTRKALALLARVALSSRPVSRDTLAALLWSDADPERARSALRRTLSVAGAVGPALVVDRASVAFDPDLVQVDVREFDSLADAAEPAAWAQAADLASDRFLDGFALRDAPAFDDWQSAAVGDLERRLGTVLDRLVAASVDQGRLDLALRQAERRLDLDPLHEPAHQSVMRLMAWTGDRSGAMNQFRTCARILDRELGVRPLPETHDLYDQIRDDGLPPPTPRRTDESRARTSATPSAPAACVGRDDVLARLDLQHAAATEGRAAVVVGESGAGRTTVVDALAARARAQGATVILLRGHEAERGLALGAVGGMVRGLVVLSPGVLTDLPRAGAAELGRFISVDDQVLLPPLDSPGAQTRLFDSVLEAVTLVARAGAVPAVLAVDDADQLDAASADFVGYLARRLPRNLLLLLSWRTPIDALSGAPVDRIALPPLSVDDARAMLARAGVPVEGPELDRLVRRTGGSPRLLHEYALSAAQGDGPPSMELRELLEARFASVDETTRQVVSAAAVLGRPADVELLRLTSGRADVELVDAVEEAVHRGLLVELAETGEYDVPYDAARDVATSRLSRARLRLLHGRAADAVAGRRSPFPVASEVAAHLAVAGRDGDSSAWYWRAAREARDLWAHTIALEHIAAALALGHDRAECHLAAGEALIALGRYREALDELEQAAQLVDGYELAVVEHRLADVHHRLGAWTTSRAHVEHALLLLDDDLEGAGASAPAGRESPAVLRARCLADIALLHYREGDLAAAEAAIDDAMATATTTGDAAALAQSHDVAGMLSAARGDLTEARTRLRASLTFAAGLDDPSYSVAALNNLALVELSDEGVDAALDAARRALELGDRHGDRHRLAALHTNLADLLHANGQPDDALEHLTRAASLFADVDRESERRPEIWKLVAW